MDIRAFGAQSTDQSTTEYWVSSSDDYSTTNIQVAGVDEADTVKTDGNYIYTISQMHRTSPTITAHIPLTAQTLFTL